MKSFIVYPSNNWKQFFDIQKQQDYFKELVNFIILEYKNNVIFPKINEIFKCFILTDIPKLKVVIIGQDPYIHKNEANGLAFSVNKNNVFPPSLKNIYKEIEIEYGQIFNKDGDLSYLAKQGVLLLNKYLTVIENKSLSHKNNLYDIFFKNVINYIESLNQPLVYLLWGNEAKKASKYIKNKNHYILYASHPSPLGANKCNWFNSKIFKNCNEILKNNNLEEINFTNNF